MKELNDQARNVGFIVMLGVITVAAILLVSPALGAVNQTGDNNPFNAIFNITDGLKIQISQLFAKTDSLQQQVASIDARNTTVNVDNNIPVPNVTVENTIPQPNITVVNNVVVGGNDTPKVKAFNAFLMINGLQGESTDERHMGWIDVLSYNHGMDVPISTDSGGSAAGRPEHKEFVITKYVDKSSPNLALYLNEGRHIPDVTLELTRTIENGPQSRQEFMEYKLRDVIISSVKVSGNSGGDTLPLEEVSFTYEKIEWTYTTQTGSKIITGWDLAANRRI